MQQNPPEPYHSPYNPNSQLFHTLPDVLQMNRVATRCSSAAPEPKLRFAGRPFCSKLQGRGYVNRLPLPRGAVVGVPIEPSQLFIIVERFSSRSSGKGGGVTAVGRSVAP